MTEAQRADEAAHNVWLPNTPEVPHGQRSPEPGPDSRDLIRVVTALLTACGAIVAGWLAVSYYQRGALVAATIVGTIALLGLVFGVMLLFRGAFATSWGFWFSGITVIWGGNVVPVAPIAGSLLVVTALLVAVLLWNGAAAYSVRAPLPIENLEGGDYVRRDR